MPNVITRRTEREDEAFELARPLTPRSERKRSSYDSLEMSMQTVPGLCPGRKCLKREGHAGGCWPTED